MQGTVQGPRSSEAVCCGAKGLWNRIDIFPLCDLTSWPYSVTINEEKKKYCIGHSNLPKVSRRPDWLRCSCFFSLPEKESFFISFSRYGVFWDSLIWRLKRRFYVDYSCETLKINETFGFSEKEFNFCYLH